MQRLAISIRVRAKNTHVFYTPIVCPFTKYQTSGVPKPNVSSTQWISNVFKIKTVLIANYKYLDSEIDFLKRLYCCWKALKGSIYLSFRRHLQRVVLKVDFPEILSVFFHESIMVENYKCLDIFLSYLSCQDCCKV